MKRTYGTSELRTPQQHQRLFGLLGKLGLGEETRHTLVHTFTNGRTTSTRDMLAHECNQLIMHLENMVPGSEHPLFNARRKLFAIAHELGWERKDGTIDRDRLNEFLMRRGAVKKPFLQLNRAELAQVITQLETMARK